MDVCVVCIVWARIKWSQKKGGGRPLTQQQCTVQKATNAKSISPVGDSIRSSLFLEDVIMATKALLKARDRL